MQHPERAQGEPALDDGADELGRLIRKSLQESVSGMEPSADLWGKIAQRIDDLDGRKRPPRVLSMSLPWASLLNTLLVSVLLVSFAGGVERDVELRRGAVTGSVAAGELHTPPAESNPESDMVRGHLLLQAARHAVARSEHVPAEAQGDPRATVNRISAARASGLPGPADREPELLD